MASRIEFATIGQVDMSKYSKNQVFSAQTAGLDLGANMPEGGGEKPLTKVTVTAMSANNGIDTITTVNKEED
jgi:hypothetical protein